MPSHIHHCIETMLGCVANQNFVFCVQAYEMLGLYKESLLDAIMFINECSQAPVNETDLKQGNRVPEYVERLVIKQMQAAWLFKDAALKHGDIHYTRNQDLDSDSKEEREEHDEFNDEEEDEEGREDEEEEEEEEEEEGEEDGSEWETASESDEVQDQAFSQNRDPNWSHKSEKKAGSSSSVFKGSTLRDLLSP